MPRTIADLMAETLSVAGVRRIYGVVGDSLNGFTDALRKQKKIDWIHMRHEEAAAFAAGAEAHLTGELAVCAGSCGPGNLHLINGLFDCQRSRVPVLAIAAHIPSAEIGGAYFQETHPEQLFARVQRIMSSWSPTPTRLPRMLEKAIRIAVARARRRGGGHAGRRRAARDRRRGRASWLAPRPPVVRPRDADVDALAELLEWRRAHHDDLRRGLRRRPCRGRGPGGSAQRARRACAARQGVRRVRQPVRCRHDRPDRLHLGLRGDEELRHPRSCSAPTSPTGSSFPRAPGSCRSTSGRRASAIAAVWPSASSATSAPRSRRCCRRLKQRADRKFLDGALAHYKKARDDLDKLAEGKPGGKVIHPQYVARLLSEVGGGRRDLHLRRRHADRVGGALPQDERQAPPDRLVQPRLDGQRAAAGDRRAGGVPGAAGRLDVGRWRLHAC